MLVWDSSGVFGARLDYAASRGEVEDEDGYEEIPHQFHGLEKSFAGIVDHAVGTVRLRFVASDPMFQFRGARLLASSFPGLPREYLGRLDSGAKFVVGLLSGYSGLAEAPKRAPPPE
jgi:hypothetical protein